jgi:1-phosphofructokinase
MLFTLTLNPSLDYYVTAPSIETGAVNRVSGQSIVAGGKGVNVARVFNKLAANNTFAAFNKLAVAIVVLGGRTGKLYEEILKAEGVPYTPVYTNGDTRINVKLTSDGATTELNGNGQADPNIIDEIIAIIKDLVKTGDMLALCGSVPVGVGNEVYARIIRETKCWTFVDTSGKPLEYAIVEKPFMIKVNKSEAEGIHFGQTQHIITSDNGAESWVLENGHGQFLQHHTVTHEVIPDPIQTVGAGDCFLAAYIYDAERCKDYKFKRCLNFADETAVRYVKGNL